MIKITSSNNQAVSELSDAALISIIKQNEGARENCQKEIVELYRRHSEDVYRMARSRFRHYRVGSKDEGDLFQAAWKQALEKIDRYDTSSHNTFAAWVKGIADNLFLEWCREDKKRDKALVQLGEEMVVGDDNEPLEESDPIFDDASHEQETPPEQMIGRELLLDALKLLSGTEQEILCEWHRTYDRNNPGSPEHVENLERLSQKHGIKKENFRKIKDRAIKKMQKKLNL